MVFIAALPQMDANPMDSSVLRAEAKLKEKSAAVAVAQEAAAAARAAAEAAARAAAEAGASSAAEEVGAGAGSSAENALLLAKIADLKEQLAQVGVGDPTAGRTSSTFPGRGRQPPRGAGGGGGHGGRGDKIGRASCRERVSSPV